jgi:hypothetical protein
MLTESQHTGEFIQQELPGSLSRDAATVEVPAATILEPGTVLGQISSTGHYAPYDDAQSDGREVAAAILYDTLDNAAGVAKADKSGVVINFGAEVRAADLTWGTGVDEDGGIADLLAVHIKVRE